METHRPRHCLVLVLALGLCSCKSVAVDDFVVRRDHPPRSLPGLKIVLVEDEKFLRTNFDINVPAGLRAVDTRTYRGLDRTATTTVLGYRPAETIERRDRSLFNLASEVCQRNLACLFDDHDQSDAVISLAIKASDRTVRWWPFPLFVVTLGTSSLLGIPGAYASNELTIEANVLDADRRPIKTYLATGQGTSYWAAYYGYYFDRFFIPGMSDGDCAAMMESLEAALSKVVEEIDRDAHWLTPRLGMRAAQ